MFSKCQIHREIYHFLFKIFQTYLKERDCRLSLLQKVPTIARKIRMRKNPIRLIKFRPRPMRSPRDRTITGVITLEGLTRYLRLATTNSTTVHGLGSINVAAQKRKLMRLANPCQQIRWRWVLTYQKYWNRGNKIRKGSNCTGLVKAGVLEKLARRLKPRVSRKLMLINRFSRQRIVS